MSRDIFRITSPTLVLFLENGGHVARMISKGELVTINSETFNGNKLVEVLWEGRAVMMFTQDLRARCEKIN
jgi:hypothetical protein